MKKEIENIMLIGAFLYTLGVVVWLWTVRDTVEICKYNKCKIINYDLKFLYIETSEGRSDRILVDYNCKFESKNIGTLHNFNLLKENLFLSKNQERENYFKNAEDFKELCKAIDKNDIHSTEELMEKYGE